MTLLSELASFLPPWPSLGTAVLIVTHVSWSRREQYAPSTVAVISRIPFAIDFISPHSGLTPTPTSRLLAGHWS